jgi:hypothetical protein
MMTMKKASITSSERTGGQEKQLKRMLEDKARSAVELALSKVNPSKEDIQKLLGLGDEIGSEMINFTIAQFQKHSTSNQPVNKAVVYSRHTYPPEYRGPKSIEDQINLLLKHLPGLDPEATFRYMHDVYSKLNLPEWVEGPFVVPNEYVLAEKFYPEIKGNLARYCAGVNLILEKIGASRAFYNYRAGQITANRFKRTAQTTEMIDRLIDMQKGADIIIHPMQLGVRYAGRAVKDVRKLYTAQEFGEGSLEVGSIVLTHPERLVRWEQLHMDCPGDEFSYGAGGVFGGAPFFGFYDDKVEFNTYKVDSANENYGSASGFLLPLPQ